MLIRQDLRLSPCIFYGENLVFLSDEMVRRELEISWGKDLFLGLHLLRFSDIARISRKRHLTHRTPYALKSKRFLTLYRICLPKPCQNANMRVVFSRCPKIN